MNKYEIMQQEASLKYETNDCTVKALAIAGNMSYSHAHDICKKRGRKAHGGLDLKDHLNCFLDAGLEVNMIYDSHGGHATMSIKNPCNELYWLAPDITQPNGSRYTPKTITRICKDGNYIAYTRGHVLSIIDGEVQDWTEGRKHHIKALFKIERGN